MRKRRGFTLVEVLTTVFLLSVALAVTVGTSQSASHKAEVRSGAETLAQVFRKARTQAMAKGVPVTVAFPAAHGSSPVSPGCYTLEGEVRARITGRCDLTKESKAVAFCGVWPTSLPILTDEPKLGLPSDHFSVADMQLPYPEDYAFVYTPSGVLKTNGLPLIDGRYHVVVCRTAGFHRSDTQTFQLDQVAQAYTVSLSPLGEVAVTNGLPGASLPEGAPAVSQIASWPHLSTASHPPRVASVKLLPSPEQLQLPPGVDTLVPKESFLTLEVSAESPDGLPLYCQWRDVTTARPPGVTSTATPQRMQYDPKAGLWTARGHWKAPAGAGDGSDYTIACEVRDMQGRLAPVTTNSMLDLEVRARKKRLLVAFPGMHPLMSVDEDGEDIKYLTSRKIVPPEPGQPPTPTHSFDTCPSWSPDGSRLLVRREGEVVGLFTMCADGSGERNLLPPGQMACAAGWSPTGESLVYGATDAAGTMNLYKANADGSSPRLLTNYASGTGFTPAVMDPMRSQPLAWREPTGGEPESVFLIHHNSDGTQQLDQVYLDSSTGAPHINAIAIGYQMDGNVAVSPDGQFCVYASSTNANDPAQLRVHYFDGRPDIQITSSADSWTMAGPSVSESGDIILNGPDGKIYRFDSTTPNQTGTTVAAACPPHTTVRMMDPTHVSYVDMSGPPAVVVMDINQPSSKKTLVQMMGPPPILGGWTR